MINRDLTTSYFRLTTKIKISKFASLSVDLFYLFIGWFDGVFCQFNFLGSLPIKTVFHLFESSYVGDEVSIFATFKFSN
uniref:Uncharacterized protein n=1 Tax=Kalanchoe fedtschenkoi TaxID=63787 RepID=A0A7N0ZUT0_KALFE